MLAVEKSGASNRSLRPKFGLPPRGGDTPKTQSFQDVPQLSQQPVPVDEKPPPQAVVVDVDSENDLGWNCCAEVFARGKWEVIQRRFSGARFILQGFSLLLYQTKFRKICLGIWALGGAFVCTQLRRLVPQEHPMGLLFQEAADVSGA